MTEKSMNREDINSKNFIFEMNLTLKNLIIFHNSLDKKGSLRQSYDVVISDIKKKISNEERKIR